MAIEFKYQTLFTCTVPDSYKTVKSFSELIASDKPQTVETLLQIMQMSFENSGVAVKRLEMSQDLNHCHAYLENEEVPILIVIRSRPSLVVDGIIYKLEELDI